MVIGLRRFTEYFKEHQDTYLIIGGSACDIIIEEAGFVPRATDDIDMILIVEVLSTAFVSKFWDFIKEANYGTRQKNEEKRNCYRFCDPATADYPKQIELFCKAPDAIDLHDGAHLTPIPVEEGLSSLSAILLNDEYYEFTKKHSTYKDDVHHANTEALICLKAFAYLDNKKKREEGIAIRNADVIKHKYDVFRMVFMLNPDDSFELPDIIKYDLQRFADAVKNELPDPAIFKANGFGNQDMGNIFQQLVKIFHLSTDNAETSEKNDDWKTQLDILKRELPNEDDVKEVYSLETIRNVGAYVLTPLFNKAIKAMEQFSPLFTKTGVELRLDSTGQPIVDENTLWNVLGNFQTQHGMVKLEIDFRGFKKNGVNVFDTNTRLECRFENERYTISHPIGERFSITKLYHEKLSEEEQDLLIASMAKQILTDIELRKKNA